MASISTLAKQQAFALVRVKNNYLKDECIYPLYRSAFLSASIDLASEEPVYENYPYDIWVLVPERCRVSELEVSINGSELMTRYEAGSDSVFINDEKYIEYRIIAYRERLYPFRLTYGFARIEVSLLYVDGNNQDAEEFLSTKDIACLSKDRDTYQVTAISEMLNELLDEENGTVSRWMFSGGENDRGDYSVFEAGAKENSPKSLSSIVQLLESVVIQYKESYMYFRSHGYKKVRKETTRLPQRMIRQAGMHELMWISKNMNSLYQTPNETSIKYNDGYYLPREVETKVKVKTYDSYENRVLLGFLDVLISAARSILLSLRSKTETIQEIETKLNVVKDDEYCFPALILVQACAHRERFYIDRIKMLILELQALQRKYSTALPGVESVFSRTPRRTKVFQEVKQYSTIYTLIMKWLRFGDFSLAKENLALQSLRLDKLYEYYVLYKILSWFDAAGFIEDSDEEKAICCAEYSLSYKKYSNERKVATLYKLKKDNVRLRLYYQPVIYGDMREENGITLHRLSRRSTSGKGKLDSFWTPDFLLYIEEEGASPRWHVFDAKYRKVDKLWSGYPVEGELTKAISKYKSDIASSLELSCVESVWLLCGRELNENVKLAEASSWSEKYYELFRSGIGSLTPSFSCLNIALGPLFKSLTQNCGDQMKNEGNSVREALKTRAEYNDAINLVKELYALIEDKGLLLKARWAEVNLGLAHPLLREVQPKGRERRFYNHANLHGKEYYVYARWLPTQKNKLQACVKQLKSNS